MINRICRHADRQKSLTLGPLRPLDEPLLWNDFHLKANAFALAEDSTWDPRAQTRDYLAQVILAATDELVALGELLSANTQDMEMRIALRIANRLRMGLEIALRHEDATDLLAC
jgi:hypothetical protein